MEKPKGFAALSPEERTAIARKGGLAAQQDGGKGHRWTEEEAVANGRRGGEAVASRPGHMAEIGRKGGRARAKKMGESYR